MKKWKEQLLWCFNCRRRGAPKIQCHLNSMRRCPQDSTAPAGSTFPRACTCPNGGRVVRRGDQDLTRWGALVLMQEFWHFDLSLMRHWRNHEGVQKFNPAWKKQVAWRSRWPISMWCDSPKLAIFICAWCAYKYSRWDWQSIRYWIITFFHNACKNFSDSKSRNKRCGVWTSWQALAFSNPVLWLMLLPNSPTQQSWSCLERLLSATMKGKVEIEI